MKKGRKQIDQSRIDHIVKLRESGLTYREICEELGCGNSTISRYTVEQPTPTPVKVPKRGWEAYAETLEAEVIAMSNHGSGITNAGKVIQTNDSKATVNDGLYIFKDDAIYRIATNITGVSPHVLEQIQKLLQEDKMNQELNELHVEYMDKEEAIRGKYNVK